MKKFAVAAMAVATGITASAAWKHGEPVTTYWFGPGCPGTNSISLAMTDAWARQLKEGGFNTVWARTPEELDIAARHGLRVIYSVDPTTEWAKVDLDDPAQKTALAERINRVKDHPALSVYEHFDEAPADWFAELARVPVADVREQQAARRRRKGWRAAENGLRARQDRRVLGARAAFLRGVPA